MKYFLIISIFLISNCSLNDISTFWLEDPKKDNLNKKIVNKILEENKDINEMTFNEYKLYLEEINKTKIYPDIN